MKETREQVIERFDKAYDKETNYFLKFVAGERGDEEPGDRYGMTPSKQEPFVFDDSWMEEAYKINNW